MEDYSRWGAVDWPEDGSTPGTLYVVPGSTDEDRQEDEIWTISFDPAVPGWSTDSGTAGYGLPRSVAEEIVRRFNAATPSEAGRSDD